MKEMNCKQCEKAFRDYVSNKRSGFCSLNCYWESMKKNREEKSQNWKGNGVSYGRLHVWIRQQLGNPNECVYCGEPNRISGGRSYLHWANVSGEYKRELDDWIPLCPTCHFKYDGKDYSKQSKKAWETRRQNYEKALKELA